jgi:hypothetical protein
MGAAVLPQKLLFFAAIYLLVKGLAFIMMTRDFASYGDFFSGIYLLVLSFGITIPVVHSIVLFWLFQKTLMTFVAIGLKLFIYYGEHREEMPSFFR